MKKFFLIGMVVTIITILAVANVNLNNKSSNIADLSELSVQNLEALTQEIDVPPGYIICYSTYRTTKTYSWEVLTTITKCNGCSEINVYYREDRSSCKTGGYYYV
jgi:hypothetical protein